MSNTLKLLGSILSVVMLIGSKAGAQSCDSVLALNHCEWEETEKHSAEDGNNNYGPSHPYPDCRLCAGPTPGACHMPCESPSLDLGTAAVLAAIRHAAEVGDAAEMMLLAHLAPDYVVVNVKRMAIQLKACSGDAIVASLTVKDTRALATLGAALDSRKRLHESVGITPAANLSK